MHPMNKYLIPILVAAAAVAAFYAYTARTHEEPVAGSNTATTTPNLSVEDYVRQNISTLSPAKEQLGGTFYVTQIEAHGGAGTVSYEDGHNAYTADFRYTVDESGAPAVTSFTLR